MNFGTKGCLYCEGECNKECLPKQETLEEYINDVTKNFKDEMSIKFTSGGIKLGAKWQAEQDKNKYSEEEVMEMFHKLSMHLPLHYEMLVREMFKKK